MAFGETRYKNAVRAGAAWTTTQQSANPIDSGDYGMWRDSSNNMLFSLAGITGGAMRQMGIIPSARLLFSQNPSDADTVTINSKTFTFKTSLTAATTTTQVKIGANAAATLAVLVNAINGVADASNIVADTTPFALTMVADAVDATHLRIRLASTQGGTAIAGASSSWALAASITSGASAWQTANLNAVGKAATAAKVSVGALTVTAAMVTYGSMNIELPFTPTVVNFNCTASTGVHRAITDAVTISGNSIAVALAGGASPAIQAGDILRFVAIE